MSGGYTIDEVGKLEEGWFFYDHAWTLAFHLMKKFVGHSVLDVGCGTGIAIGIYQNCLLDKKFVGCEPNDVSAEIWKRRNVNAVIGSATNLPFERDEFDTVVSSHVIEHIEDHLTAVNEMVRVAKKRLIVVVPEGDVDSKNFGSPHLRYYDRVSFVNLFEDIKCVNKRGYSLPHSHMNNLIMDIEF
ncbi:MAG: class I SAM-dependent methyltransferase [Pseudomonadota bacterium]|nr:class I SAM-dependent methyltransferase [Pseudomonadota bacterium]